MRPALFAVGVGAAVLVFAALRRAPVSKSSPPAREKKPMPDWHSDYRPDAQGRVSEDDLIDQAMADSFPASDPPAYSSRVTSGRPV